MTKKANLPRGVSRQLEQAIERTGKTPALRLAAKRLPVILDMTPAQFEAYSQHVMENKKRP